MIIRHIRRAVGVAAVIAASLIPTMSQAGTDNADLAVSASVAANCVISTAPLAFGAYDPIDIHAASPLDGTGTVSVTCTDGAAAVIELDEGDNADTGSTTGAPLRRLAGGGDYLAYTLFSDSNRTEVWATGGSVDVAHTGTGTQANLTVYGRIAAGQTDASATAYTDSVVATVTF